MTYQEQLNDPRWIEKKTRILERDNYKCRYCRNDLGQMHVHHMRYKGMAWEAPDYWLVTLCKTCHAKAHCEFGILNKKLLKFTFVPSVRLVKLP